jgi:predicted transcriptional regulator
MTGMKMLLESKSTELSEANSKLENEREVFRGKISSLKEEVNAKESQILEFHDKQLEDQLLIAQFLTKMAGVESKVSVLTEERLKL